MRAGSQLSFGGDFKQALVHGGEYSKGKRKSLRPISTKKPMHVTLRSSEAVGKLSFRQTRNLSFIENLLPGVAKKWGIRLYRVSINGNHLHFALKAETCRGFQNFLRVVSAQVARFVTGARRGKPFGKRFWDLPAFTRIVEWGKAFSQLCDYVVQNVLETIGAIEYRPRGRKLKKPNCEATGPMRRRPLRC